MRKACSFVVNDYCDPLKASVAITFKLLNPRTPTGIFVTIVISQGLNYSLNIQTALVSELRFCCIEIVCTLRYNFKKIMLIDCGAALFFEMLRWCQNLSTEGFNVLLEYGP